MTDDEQDVEFAASLRRHAEELTGPIDTEAALADVRRRGVERRRRRQVTSAVLAVAAAVVAVIAVGAVVGDDRPTVRTPAADAADTDVAPTSNLPAPPTMPVAPTTAAPVTTVTPPAPSTAPPTTQMPPSAPATAAPPTSPMTATPTVARYDSAGGSIAVRVANGVVRLDGAPVPAAGFTYRIDDDGPDRVRVRFERDSARSEIRIELVGGQLIPEILEG